MIREVEIRGFKSLSQVDFELGRVNCIIGANGTGKSNLLEALGVLGAGDRQILFTIHNPAGLDGLDLSDSEIRLFVVERNSNGQTNIRRLQLTPELVQLNQKYPLSRLWLMGNLGGVPNV